MTRVGYLIAMTTLVVAAGCSKDNASPPPPAPCPPGLTCDVTVTKESAKTYFTQLKYQTAGGCTDQTTMRFEWLVVADRVVVAKDIAAATETVAELNLYLNADDGTYTGEYQENVQKFVAAGFWDTTAVLNKKDLKGTWSTQDLALALSDLGSADAATINNLPGMKLKVAGTSLNASLNGQTLSMVMNRSKISKDLKTVAQVCTEGVK